MNRSMLEFKGGRAYGYVDGTTGRVAIHFEEPVSCIDVPADVLAETAIDIAKLCLNVSEELLCVLQEATSTPADESVKDADNDA